LLAVAAAAYAMFPAILSFNMVFDGNNSLLPASLFLFLITTIVLSFILSVIIMYTFYMYPALVNFKKGSFYMGKKIVNAKFWYIVPRVMTFVIALAAWQLFLAHMEYGLASFSSAIAAFILNGIVKTYLVFSLVFFIFFTFRQIKNALQTEEMEDEADSDEIEPVMKMPKRTTDRRTERPERERNRARRTTSTTQIIRK